MRIILPPVALLVPSIKILLSLIRFRPFDTATQEGRSKERYRRIVLTTISGLAARTVAIAANLVTVPITLSYLGKEQYGLLTAIISITTWIVLFDFGIINGLVNMIAEAHGKDDKQAVASYTSTAFFSLIAAISIITLVFAFAVPIVPWDSVFNVSTSLDKCLARESVVAAMIPIILGMPLSVTRQVYAGYQKTYMGNVFLMLGSVLSVFALLLAIRFKANLPAIILVQGASMLSTSFLNFVYLITIEMPWTRPRLSLISSAALKRLLSVSVPLFIFQVGALLVNNTQFVILAHSTNLEIVTDYSIIMRVYLLPISLIALSTYSFIPSFRESFERGDHGWSRLSFKRMLWIRMALTLISALFMIICGNSFLCIWLHRADIQFEPLIWFTLGVVMVASVWGTAFSDLLTIMDRIWVQVAFVFLNGVATIALTIYLSSKLGVLGAIAAMGFVAVFVLSWAYPLLARSILTLK